MPRRLGAGSILRGCARAVGGGVLAVALGCSPTAQRPNVIVYVVDTLRADHLSLYGYERETSPRLEHFAQDALVYDTAYAPTSWTRPSTASLLTGRYPLAHGAIKRADAIAPDIPMLGELLQAEGYTTAAFSTNVNVLPIWGFDRGFDHFYDIDSETWLARSERVNEVVLEHLARNGKEPFFLYIHTRDPHVPYRPPPPFDTLWPAGEDDNVVNRYDGEIRANDHFFGELLDALKDQGLYDDALILFTSDHGEEMLDRGGVGHGYSLFEEVVSIPFVLKYPGNVDGGLRLAGPASLLDVFPTVLGIIGEDAPEDLDGVDLRARPPGSKRPLFFDLNLLLQGQRYVMDGVRVGHHKLVEEIEPKRETTLFDLDSDSGELTSLSESEAAVGQHLGGLLGEFRLRARSGLQLALVGAGQPGALSAQVTLRTEGRFTGLRGIALEPDDEAVVGPDAQTLSLSMVLPARVNPAGGRPAMLVDVDRIAIEVEPPSAAVTIESFELGSAPGSIFVGSTRRDAGAAPTTFVRNDPALAVERMDTLLPITKQVSVVASPGLYVGSVAPPSEAVDIDEETERRLRELGYVE